MNVAITGPGGTVILEADAIVGLIAMGQEKLFTLLEVKTLSDEQYKLIYSILFAATFLGSVAVDKPIDKDLANEMKVLSEKYSIPLSTVTK